MHHKDDPPLPEDDENKEKRTDDIEPWDQEFLKVDQGTLFELILVSVSECVCVCVQHITDATTGHGNSFLCQRCIICVLYMIVQAANYLDIKGLLDVTCKTVANMIKGVCVLTLLYTSTLGYCIMLSMSVFCILE